VGDLVEDSKKQVWTKNQIKRKKIIINKTIRHENPYGCEGTLVGAIQAEEFGRRQKVVALFT